jgi:hypothetical protein
MQWIYWTTPFQPSYCAIITIITVLFGPSKDSSSYFIRQTALHSIRVNAILIRQTHDVSAFAFLSSECLGFWITAGRFGITPLPRGFEMLR